MFKTINFIIIKALKLVRKWAFPPHSIREYNKGVQDIYLKSKIKKQSAGTRFIIKSTNTQKFEQNVHEEHRLEGDEAEIAADTHPRSLACCSSYGCSCKARDTDTTLTLVDCFGGRGLQNNGLV